MAWLGARQVGKTTLAGMVMARAGAATCFDLEDPRDETRLASPMLALEPLRGLVVLGLAARHRRIGEAHDLAGQGHDGDLGVATRLQRRRSAIVRPRLLFLRIRFAILASRQYASVLAHLQRALRGHPDQMPWAIEPVIRHLGHGLSPADPERLSAIADAINHPDKRSAQ